MAEAVAVDAGADTKTLATVKGTLAMVVAGASAGEHSDRALTRPSLDRSNHLPFRASSFLR